MVRPVAALIGLFLLAAVALPRGGAVTGAGLSFVTQTPELGMQVGPLVGGGLF
jgi:hypothetical protein